MKTQKKCLVAVTLLLLLGCNTPKKLQRNYGFSDTCRESYQFFLARIIRENDDDLIEFIEPVDEIYEQLDAELSTKNDCWYHTLSENAIISLLGTPHKRGVGHRTGEVTIRYYIRTKNCMNLNEVNRPDDFCGLLMFTFTKKGNPDSGLFYALHPAKKKE